MKKQILILIAITIGTFSNAQTLLINAQNIKSNKGQLLVSIFENEKQYLDEKPVTTYIIDKSDILQGKKTIKLQLKLGSYGITIIDDTDKDKNLTTNLIGYPKEGIGLSNYKLKAFKRPKFNEFKFNLNESIQSIHIDLTYL